MTQKENAEAFKAMHTACDAFVLPNCWDAISAKILERAGYAAIATASAAIAWSHGVADGENLTRDELIDAIRRIVRSVDVPVSADIEKGYGDSAQQVGETVRSILDAGVAGINLEDSTTEGAQRPIPEMRSRITAARDAASKAGIPLVINARVDAYLLGKSGDEVLYDTITRGNVWLEAGADCVFVPGVDEPDVVRRLVEAIDGPVNIIVLNAHTPPVEELSRLGVKRISLGPRLMQSAMGHLERNARQIRTGGEFGFLSEIPSFSEINGWFSR